MAGPRFRLVVMAKVLELDPGDCLAAVDRAVRAGVLVIAPDAGEGWFADEGARRVAEGRLTLADRADLHRRFADVLESEPGPDHGQIAAAPVGCCRGHRGSGGSGSDSRSVWLVGPLPPGIW